MAANYLTQSEYFKNNFMKKVNELESSGEWAVLERKSIPNYHDDVEGIGFVFKKC